MTGPGSVVYGGFEELWSSFPWSEWVRTTKEVGLMGQPWTENHESVLQAPFDHEAAIVTLDALPRNMQRMTLKSHPPLARRSFLSRLAAATAVFGAAAGPGANIARAQTPADGRWQPARATGTKG